jgi:hypothetical protein
VSARSAELDGFLEVVTKLLRQFVGPGERAVAPETYPELTTALAEADLRDLALETVDLQDARTWLAETVRTAAALSPSVAFALASRYAGQRALLRHGDAATADVAAAVMVPQLAGSASDQPTVRAIVPTLFPVRTAVLVDASTGYAAAILDPGERRAVAVIGLRDAGLVEILAPLAPAELLAESAAQQAVADWALLCAAVSLGIAESAVSLAERYAGERVQFGVPIASFSGLRAILVGMSQRASEGSARLARALPSAAESPLEAMEFAEAAGAAAVDVGLAGIQVYGGYGYIDEYPMAALVRDAISVQARNLPRRVITARLGQARLTDGRRAIG